MIHTGVNEIDGITVAVVRKRCRRINLRVDSTGGVHLTVPKWWATLRAGEEFLRSKWDWVVKTRTKMRSQQVGACARPITEAEVAALRDLLGELHAKWSGLLGVRDVQFKIRKVRSYWGNCRWVKKCITYNAELAHAPRELVAYVVVHEFTHFDVHGHGPKFQALMTERLPGWQILRKRLNARAWGEPTERG